MDVDRRLCPHLAAAGLPALPRQADDILDWADGATVAVVRCPLCDGCGLLELLDWTPDGRLRVFALCAIGRAEVALYQRDVQRGSCDPARMAAEQQALLASAGPSERLVALEAHGESVLATAPWPEDTAPANGPWRDRLPQPEDDHWFRLVGLSKA